MSRSSLVTYPTSREPRNIVQLCTRSSPSPPSKSEDVAVEIVAVVVVEVLAVVLEVLVLVPLLITVLGVPKRKPFVEVVVVNIARIANAVQVTICLLVSTSVY